MLRRHRSTNLVIRFEGAPEHRSRRATGQMSPLRQNLQMPREPERASKAGYEGEALPVRGLLQAVPVRRLAEKSRLLAHGRAAARLRKLRRPV